MVVPSHNPYHGKMHCTGTKKPSAFRVNEIVFYRVGLSCQLKLNLAYRCIMSIPFPIKIGFQII